MDYSSSVNDVENPAGASPWGSSPTPSPQHTRTSFNPSSGDAPPSPSPYREHRPVSNGSYTSEGSGDFNRPEVVGLASGTEHDTQEPDLGAMMQSEQPIFGGQQEHRQYQQSQLHFPSEQNREERASAARRAQSGVQYKLQAKITGLERTGRKDPILRFDVHVSLIHAPRLPKTMQTSLIVFKDQSTLISHNTIS